MTKIARRRNGVTAGAVVAILLCAGCSEPTNTPSPRSSVSVEDAIASAVSNSPGSAIQLEGKNLIGGTLEAARKKLARTTVALPSEFDRDKAFKGPEVYNVDAAGKVAPVAPGSNTSERAPVIAVLFVMSANDNSAPPRVGLAVGSSDVRAPAEGSADYRVLTSTMSKLMGTDGPNYKTFDSLWMVTN